MPNRRDDLSYWLQPLRPEQVTRYSRLLERPLRYASNPLSADDDGAGDRPHPPVSALRKAQAPASIRSLARHAPQDARPPLDPVLYRTLSEIHATGDAHLKRLVSHAVLGLGDLGDGPGGSALRSVAGELGGELHRRRQPAGRDVGRQIDRHFERPDPTHEPAQPRSLQDVYSAIGKALRTRNHPLADSHNWDRVGRGVALDHAVERHLAERGIDAKHAHRIVLNQSNTRLGANASDLDRQLHATLPGAEFHDRQKAYVRKFIDSIRDQIPDATAVEVRNAFVRAAMRARTPFGPGAGGATADVFREQAPPRLRDGHLRRYQRVRYARFDLRATFNPEFQKKARETDARVRSDPSWQALPAENRETHERTFREFMSHDHMGHILAATDGHEGRASDVATDLLVLNDKLFSKYDPSVNPNLMGSFRAFVNNKARSPKKMREMSFTDAFPGGDDAPTAEESFTGTGRDGRSLNTPERRKAGVAMAEPRRPGLDSAYARGRRARMSALRGEELDRALLAEVGKHGADGMPWGHISKRGYHPEASAETLSRLESGGQIRSLLADPRADLSPHAGRRYYLPEHAPAGAMTEGAAGKLDPRRAAAERRSKVRELFASGLSYRDVADRLGVHPSAVVRDAQALGLMGSTPKARARSEAKVRVAEQVRQAKELVRQGLPPAEIGRRLGLGEMYKHVARRAKAELAAEAEQK